MKLKAAAGVLALGLGVSALAWNDQATSTQPVSAVVTRVIDGDTLHVETQHSEARIRVAGVDTPELRGRCEWERQAAQRARDWVVDAALGQRVTVTPRKLDRYGRVVASVRLPDGRDLAVALVMARLGRAYAGGRRQPWCEGNGAADNMGNLP